MSTSDDTRPERFYARPRDGESDDEFAQRFRDGFFALVDEYQREHPEASDDVEHSEARARAQERLRKLREG